MFIYEIKLLVLIFIQFTTCKQCWNSKHWLFFWHLFTIFQRTVLKVALCWVCITKQRLNLTNYFIVSDGPICQSLQKENKSRTELQSTVDLTKHLRTGPKTFLQCFALEQRKYKVKYCRNVLGCVLVRKNMIQILSFRKVSQAKQLLGFVNSRHFF